MNNFLKMDEFNKFKEEYKLNDLETTVLMLLTDNDLKKVKIAFMRTRAIYEKILMESDFPDRKKASKAIIEKLKDGNKHIVLVTDYDADGVTSASVLYKGFNDILEYGNDNKITLIVNNRKYGNGVNDEIVKRLLELNSEKKIDIIITADHGSADEDRYKILKNVIEDLMLVVTDHHLLPENSYPISADYFLNAQDKVIGKYGNQLKYISGCFTAYLLIEEILKNKNIDKLNILERELLPIVAISTLTDSMDMSIPLNRSVVMIGLEFLNETDNPLFNSLKKIVNNNFNILENDLSFKIGPILNAAGRMNMAEEAANFLISNEYNINENFKRVKELNSKRKEYQKIMEIEAKKSIKKYSKILKNATVIVLPEGEGIAGILAGKYGEIYGKPTIVFTLENNVLKGSARAIVDGLNIKEVFDKIEEEDNEIFLKKGGHAGAAGCSIKLNKLDDFIKLLDKILDDYNYDIKNDVVIGIDKPNLKELLRAVFKFRPYGRNWPEPIFKSEFMLAELFRMGNTSHNILKLKSKDNKVIEAIYFDSLIKLKSINVGDNLEVEYNVTLGRDKGKVVPTMRILSADKIS